MNGSKESCPHEVMEAHRTYDGTEVYLTCDDCEKSFMKNAYDKGNPPVVIVAHRESPLNATFHGKDVFWGVASWKTALLLTIGYLFGWYLKGH